MRAKALLWADGRAAAAEFVPHGIEPFHMLNGLDAPAQIKVGDRVKVMVD